MPRTTVNLDPSVLGQLRQRQRGERKPLSELINQLLAKALAETEPSSGVTRRLRWTSRAMTARVLAGRHGLPAGRHPRSGATTGTS